jgi:hypothetical protein
MTLTILVFTVSIMVLLELLAVYTAKARGARITREAKRRLAL